MRAAYLSQGDLTIRLERPRFRVWSRQFKLSIWDHRRILRLPVQFCQQLTEPDLEQLFAEPDLNSIILRVRERGLAPQIDWVGTQ